MNHFVLRHEFPAFWWYWKCIVLDRLGLSFDLGSDRTWTFYGSIRVIKRTSTGPWTNNVRHCVIICHLRLVKTRRIENFVSKFGFIISSEMSQILREREIIFNIFRDVWKGQIFLWVGFTKGYRGTSDK